jgi:hypothetical protein
MPMDQDWVMCTTTSSRYGRNIFYHCPPTVYTNTTGPPRYANNLINSTNYQTQ